MNKTELLNRLAQDGEERTLLARTMDRIEQAQRRSVPAWTSFLSPHEAEAVARLIAAAGYPRHLWSGGFEGAERRVCAFLPDWMEADLFDGEGPIVALRAVWQGGERLTHRDFLGALMGMGVTREKVGDLLVSEGRCDMLVLREISDFLCQSMESAGRVKLRLTPCPLSEVEPPQLQVKTIRDTLAALRMDAAAAAGFSISRSKAADLISAGRVSLNWQECRKGDRTVGEGDVISCRGLGKCVIQSVGGLSKKGRIAVTIERYS
ncbi:MAG: RNA-binding protein [Oscillospiraceae bacterium]|nr:RNA-binding protein [Oscillospiraceae bacterium]